VHKTLRLQYRHEHKTLTFDFPSGRRKHDRGAERNRFKGYKLNARLQCDPNVGYFIWI
jgi:hypothetical protein